MYALRRYRQIALALLALLAVALIGAACGAAAPTATPVPPTNTPVPEATNTPAPTPTEEMAMPGEGETLSIARATWDTGWFQAKIYRVLLERLGYEVNPPDTLDNPQAYLSIARGEVDFWANGWFPLHNTYLEGEQVQGKVEKVGFQVENGALQGYLVDKKTVENEGIDNLEDLKDPEVAKMFDGNGNGTADLFGCPAGWGCELTIEHHLDAYELRDTVEHIQGAYAANMAEAVTRYQNGEPILFYTWTPNWTVNRLVPDEDVMWIGVPRPDLPEEQKELEDQTTVAGVEGCVADPCPMGWPANDVRVVANKEFLSNNPAARRLFELVEIPLDDIAAQNAKMEEGEDSEAAIRGHAEQWVEDNQEKVNEWLNEARAAAGG